MSKKKKNAESKQTKTKPQTEPRPTNFFASLVVKLVHLEVFPSGHKELFTLVQGCRVDGSFSCKLFDLLQPGISSSHKYRSGTQGNSTTVICTNHQRRHNQESYLYKWTLSTTILKDLKPDQTNLFRSHKNVLKGLTFHNYVTHG